jgi:hypothetical protein
MWAGTLNAARMIHAVDIHASLNVRACRHKAYEGGQAVSSSLRTLEITRRDYDKGEQKDLRARVGLGFHACSYCTILFKTCGITHLSNSYVYVVSQVATPQAIASRRHLEAETVIIPRINDLCVN